jgi:TolA-binding protein
MKTISKFLIVNVWVFSLIVLVNCAGSKSKENPDDSSPAQDDYGEIEQLLGISPESQKNTSQQSQDEDLIQLLNEPDDNTQGTSAAKSAPPQDRVSELEGEVTDLNKKLQDKNKTIDILQSQVVAMEQESKKPSSSSASFIPSSNMSDAEYERQYQAGLDLANNKQPREAIRVFEGLLAANDQHSLSDNAQYWIGECYYALGDYKAAILAFEKVFTFKNSNKNDYAQYKLGLCYYQLKDRERARQEFQSLLDNYSNSPLIGKAEEYMAKL